MGGSIHLTFLSEMDTDIKAFCQTTGRYELNEMWGNNAKFQTGGLKEGFGVDSLLLFLFLCASNYCSLRTPHLLKSDNGGLWRTISLDSCMVSVALLQQNQYKYHPKSLLANKFSNLLPSNVLTTL